MDIVLESEYKCAITGFITPFHTGRRYWSLSIDHKLPLKDGKQLEGVWSKDNLQVTSTALNILKGHYSDAEAKLWYRHFLQSQPA